MIILEVVSPDRYIKMYLTHLLYIGFFLIISFKSMQWTQKHNLPAVVVSLDIKRVLDGVE